MIQAPRSCPVNIYDYMNTRWLANMIMYKSSLLNRERGRRRERDEGEAPVWHQTPEWHQTDTSLTLRCSCLTKTVWLSRVYILGNMLVDSTIYILVWLSLYDYFFHSFFKTPYKVNISWISLESWIINEKLYLNPIPIFWEKHSEKESQN